MSSLDSSTPAPTPPSPSKAPAPAKAPAEWRETLSFLVKLVIVVALFRSFLFSPFNIPSESMLPRLYIGDYLFISKWNYGYSRYSLPFSLPLIPGRVFAHDPARGDVVVFKGPPGDEVDVIKRIIGLPGDTIQVIHGQVMLNGTAVPKQKINDFILPLSPNYDSKACGSEFQTVDDGGKPVCRYMQFRETLPNGKSYNVLDRGEMPDRDETGVYHVPAGRVFVMGDNRDNSSDSRFPAPADAQPGEQAGMGFVPMERIEGKAVVSFWSTDGSANWFLPWTWVSAARWRRIGEGF